MRVWDIPPERLCDKHLLGEHREIHAIWTVITEGKKGYSKHPETLRWVGRLKALYLRHELVVKEMRRRGFAHNSPLDKRKAVGSSNQETFVNTFEEQVRMLRLKGCSCRV